MLLKYSDQNGQQLYRDGEGPEANLIWCDNKMLRLNLHIPHLGEAGIVTSDSQDKQSISSSASTIFCTHKCSFITLGEAERHELTIYDTATEDIQVLPLDNFQPHQLIPLSHYRGVVLIGSTAVTRSDLKRSEHSIAYFVNLEGSLHPMQLYPLELLSFISEELYSCTPKKSFPACQFEPASILKVLDITNVDACALPASVLTRKDDTKEIGCYLAVICVLDIDSTPTKNNEHSLQHYRLLLIAFELSPCGSKLRCFPLSYFDQWNSSGCSLSDVSAALQILHTEDDFMACIAVKHPGKAFPLVDDPSGDAHSWWISLYNYDLQKKNILNLQKCQWNLVRTFPVAYLSPGFVINSPSEWPDISLSPMRCPSDAYLWSKVELLKCPETRMFIFLLEMTEQMSTRSTYGYYYFRPRDGTIIPENDVLTFTVERTLDLLHQNRHDSGLLRSLEPYDTQTGACLKNFHQVYLEHARISCSLLREFLYLVQESVCDTTAMYIRSWIICNKNKPNANQTEFAAADHDYEDIKNEWLYLKEYIIRFVGTQNYESVSAERALSATEDKSRFLSSAIGNHILASLHLLRESVLLQEKYRNAYLMVPSLIALAKVIGACSYERYYQSFNDANGRLLEESVYDLEAKTGKEDFHSLVILIKQSHFKIAPSHLYNVVYRICQYFDEQCVLDIETLIKSSLRKIVSCAGRPPSRAFERHIPNSLFKKYNNIMYLFSIISFLQSTEEKYTNLTEAIGVRHSWWNNWESIRNDEQKHFSIQDVNYTYRKGEKNPAVFRILNVAAQQLCELNSSVGTSLRIEFRKKILQNRATGTTSQFYVFIDKIEMINESLEEGNRTLALQLNASHTLKIDNYEQGNDVQPILRRRMLKILTLPLARGLLGLASQTTNSINRTSVKKLPLIALEGVAEKLTFEIQWSQVEDMYRDTTSTEITLHGSVRSTFMFWAIFHNACSHGLALMPNARADPSKIYSIEYAKSLLNFFPSAVAQAGWLLALGLLGHLREIQLSDIYSLTTSHGMRDALIVSILLGVAISSPRTGRTDLGEYIAMHIPGLEQRIPVTASNDDTIFRRPSTPYQESLARSCLPNIEYSSAIRQAAFVSLGVLHMGSCHDIYSATLLKEMGNTYEYQSGSPGYSLSAGIGIGFLWLGKGSLLTNSMKNPTVRRLLELIPHCEGMGFYDEQQVFERVIGENNEFNYFAAVARLSDLKSRITARASLKTLNETRTERKRMAIGACMGLCGMFIHSNDSEPCSALFSALDSPLCEYLTPEQALVFSLCSHLIRWDEIGDDPTWCRSQILPVFQGVYSESTYRATQLHTRPGGVQHLQRIETHKLAGTYLALAFRHVGNKRSDLRDFLITELISLYGHAGNRERDGTHPSLAELVLNSPLGAMSTPSLLSLVPCMAAAVLSLGLIMVGTADKSTIQSFEKVEAVADSTSCFGLHYALSLAKGFLGLGKGLLTFEHNAETVFALLCSVLPILPVGPWDEASFLPALRHLCASYATSRVLHTFDSGTKKSVSCRVQIMMNRKSKQMRSSVENIQDFSHEPESFNITCKSPCTIPTVEDIAIVRIEFRENEKYLPIELNGFDLSTYASRTGKKLAYNIPLVQRPILAHTEISLLDSLPPTSSSTRKDSVRLVDLSMNDVTDEIINEYGNVLHDSPGNEIRILESICERRRSETHLKNSQTVTETAPKKNDWEELQDQLHTRFILPVQLLNRDANVNSLQTDSENASSTFSTLPRNSETWGWHRQLLRWFTSRGSDSSSVGCSNKKSLSTYEDLDVGVCTVLSRFRNSNWGTESTSKSLLNLAVKCQNRIATFDTR